MADITTDFLSFGLQQQNGHFQLDGATIHPSISRKGEFEWQVTWKDRSFRIFVHKVDKATKTVHLTVNGKPTQVNMHSRVEKLIQDLGLVAHFHQKTDAVKAPMPGLIHSVTTSEGATVKKGDPLLILEAMKMENVIKAPEDGVISQIHVTAQDSVEKNALLVSFE